MKTVLFKVGNVLDGYRKLEGTSDHPLAETKSAKIHITDNGKGGIEIRAEEGVLMVSPRYANSVYISVEPLFPKPKKKKKGV